MSRTKPINTELLAPPACFNQEPEPHCPSLRFSSPRPLAAPRAWWHLDHFHLASTTGPPWPQQQGTWAQHGHNMDTTTMATTDCPDTAATADHLDVMPMATGSPGTPGCCGAVVNTHHHAPHHCHHSHHPGSGHVPAILGTLQQGPSAMLQTLPEAASSAVAVFDTRKMCPCMSSELSVSFLPLIAPTNRAYSEYG